jgi:autotransporter-associated beta strand protein
MRCADVTARGLSDNLFATTTMKTPGRIGSISFCLLLALSSGFASSTAEATTREFVGAAAGTWSVAGNWNPAGTPAAGDDLVFPVGVVTDSYNDLAFIVLRSIRFDGAHTIKGARFDITVGIEVFENATIENTVILQPGAAITGDATLAISGQLDAGGDFSITGVTIDATFGGNNFNGLITIGAGATYRLGTEGALGSPGPPVGAGASVHLAAGGTLNMNGKTASVNRLTGTGTVDLGSGPAGAMFAVDIALATTSEFTGAITGMGSFRKNGPGTMTLGGATSFNGVTYVQQGELIITHPQAIANSTTNVLTTGTLIYDVSSTRTNPLNLAGFGPTGGGALRLRGGTLTQNAATNIDVANATIAVAAPHQLLQQGSLTGPTTLTVMGGGTVVLGNPVNTVHTVVLGDGAASAPTMRLGVAGALAGITATTINANSTLDFGTFHSMFGNCSGTGRIVVGNGGIAQFLDTPAFTGTFHGPGNVVMMATVGPVTLAGTHTLSGTFDTQSSHLTMTGTFPAEVRSAGDKVTLAPGSTIGPFLYAPISTSGQVIVGDSISPGGTTTGGLQMLGGSFKPILSDASARMIANGAVNIANSTLDLSGAGATIPPGMLTLIANDGSDPITGVFSNAPAGAQVTLNGVVYVVGYNGGDGNDLTLTPPTTTYYLSEGATGSFFDTDLLIANPWNQSIVVDLTFLPENAAPLARQITLLPRSRQTLHVDTIQGMESVAFSTIVKPQAELPIAVERTMRWDASGYGAHTEKATSGPATTWYFAEGSEGFFRTFLLLANPQTTANVAHVTWLREGTTAIERTYELTPTSRKTIAALDDAELVNQAFGITVTFDQPGVAERAMYFGGPPVFKGGHESAGVTAPSTTWLLAEGATGDGFDTFILIANPGSEVADVTFTFLPSSGLPATLTRQVAGNSRITVNPEAEDLPIPIGPVATQVTATKPVIAERAQYWPLGPIQWTEAHNSFGVTEAAPRWALAEGRVGGAEGYQTYILLANPGSTTANVELDYLGDGHTTEPATVTVQVPPQQRVNVPVDTQNANTVAVTFGTSITSDQPIVVERAMYWNVNGEIWAAGTNATATRMFVP